MYSYPYEMNLHNEEKQIQIKASVSNSIYVVFCAPKYHIIHFHITFKFTNLVLLITIEYCYCCLEYLFQ